MPTPKDLFPDVVDLSQGIESNRCDLDANFRYTPETLNVTTGINAGIGPRYGIAPLPNHSHQDPTAFPPPNDLATVEMAEKSQADLFSDGLSNETLYGRLKVYAILPITMGTFEDPGSKSNYYVWIFQYEAAPGDHQLVYCINAETLNGTSLLPYKPIFSDGFYQNVTAITSHNPLFSLISSDAYFASYLSVDQDTNTGRFATFTVKGQNYEALWLYGDKKGPTPDVTHSANVNLCYGYGGTVNMGVTPEINLGSYDISLRSLIAYNLSFGRLERAYFYDTFGGSNPYNAALNADTTVLNINFPNAGVADREEARLDGLTPNYAQVSGVLFNDPYATVNSSYTAVLAAIGSKPRAVIIQDWQRDATGRVTQPIDLTSFGYADGSRVTLDGEESAAAGSYYSESEDTADNLTVRNTCFAYWPYFVRGLPLINEASIAYDPDSQQVVLGPANSGILRKDTVYEFTYSIFDKRFGYESNVGIPAKFQTNDEDDFISLVLLKDAKNGLSPNQFLQLVPYTNLVKLPVDPRFVTDVDTPLNYLEIRFYYREEGGYEWLPALFIDATKYFFYPNHGILRACTGPIVGLPGGQVGGFQDYSNLPKKPYVDVVNYQNRAFWVSPDSIHFSLPNNVLAYPVRNTVTARTGQFLGAIVHNYPGQAQQSSRYVVFGTAEIYVGRFTGNRALVNVQIGPEASDIGQFELDGSDFVLDAWTSNTAFSARSAVVADGILFFWGPQGIFRDNGVDTPERISIAFEPDIFNLYDHTRQSEIHGVYSDATKEVIWFYPKANRDDGVTGMLVWDVQDNAIFLGEIRGIVDDAFKLNISQMGAVYGDRTIVTMRAARQELVQRAYFFDWKNRAGDWRPGTEFMVKNIANTSATTRTLTLAVGYDPAILSGLSPGLHIVLNQAQAYGDVITVEDMYAKISSVDAGAGEIVIVLPTDAVLDGQAFDGPHYLPLYLEGVNSIPYAIVSKYWAPYGINFNGYWLAVHVFFKIKLLKSNTAPELTLAFRTPVSLSSKSVTVTLIDNSDGNCQRYCMLSPGEESAEGQGLKLNLSGSHLGGEWVLQYILAAVNNQTFDFLRRFEQEED